VQANAYKDNAHMHICKDKKEGNKAINFKSSFFYLFTLVFIICNKDNANDEHSSIVSQDLLLFLAETPCKFK
jgi:hypothetical protein